jgi:hypothetical protein
LNRRPDVRNVQLLLNRNIDRLGEGAAPLTVDGVPGPDLELAIFSFQRRALNMSPPDCRVDPNGKTFQALLDGARKRVRVAVAVDTWAGKGDHFSTGFRLCARTALGEFRGATGTIAHTPTMADMLDLFKALAAQCLVQELHVYGHCGPLDGPVFSDGQFKYRGLLKGALPPLAWAEDAKACFYGCTVGLGPWVLDFAVFQKVTVYGSAGFSLFSKRRFEFYPFDGEPDQPPCYLDCFQGLEESLIKRYGLTTHDGWQRLWRSLVVLPEVIAARNKHYPPKPMVVIKPDGSKQ